MDITFITQPWLLAFAAAVLSLHALTFFVPKLRFPLTVVNVLVHVASIAVLLIAGATLEETLLFLLISACVSLLFGRLEENKK